MAQHDNHEYRFAAIEKRLDKLDSVHEIVTRLDERFDKLDIVTDSRLNRVEETQTVQGKDVEELKTFKWKAVGTISLALVFVSIFGSAIGNAIVKKLTSSSTSTPHPPSEQLSYFNETNLNGYYQTKDPITTKGSSQLMQQPSTQIVKH